MIKFDVVTIFPDLFDSFVKESLAIEMREHYRKHPAALDLQATANIIPPTVANHS